MQQFTSRTILAPEILFENLAQYRKQGFALSEQEYEEEINAVAAPILDAHGQPIAAITVAGPAYRLLRERMHEIGPIIVATAREIAQAFEMEAVAKY